MEKIIRKLGVIFLVAAFLTTAGCLNKSSEKNNVTSVVESNGGQATNPDTPDTPTNPDTTPTPTNPAYNANSNKRPVVTYFNTKDLTSPEVNGGQKVKFETTTMDPEGGKTTVEYTATGGSFAADGTWTAPTKPGYYQVSAIAVDDKGLKSDPASWTIRVKKDPAAGGIVLRSIPTVVKSVPNNSFGPQRSLAVTDASTTQTKYIMETSQTATITLVFTDTDNSHAVSTNFSYGSLTQTGASNNGTTYTYTYTYTAPSTAPSGNSASVVFNVFDPNDSSDSDSATITFIIDTAPTISNVALSVSGGSSTNTIAPSGTGTITVTASDADTGDTITYNYSILTGSGTLAESTNTTGTVDFTAPSSTGTTEVLIQLVDSRGANAEEMFTIAIATPMTVVAEDSGVSGATEAAKYTEATGSNAANYDITTDTVNSSQVSIPISNSSDMNTLMGNNAYYYYTGAPSTTIIQTWSVYNEIDSTKVLGTTGKDFGVTTRTFDFNPGTEGVDNGTRYKYMMRGGVKTLKATVDSGTSPNNQVVYASDTVYVNELPSLTGITYTDAQGNSQSLFDGTTLSTVQVSPGQKFNLTMSVSDPDNTRVSPDTTNYPLTSTSGYFANQAYDAGRAGGGTAGIDLSRTLVDGASADSSWTIASSNATDIYDPTSTSSPSYYTFTNDYTTTLSNVPVEIKPSATVDTTGTTPSYHYLALHLNDGTEQLVDEGAIKGPWDYYRVGTEVVDADGADIGAGNLKVDIGTRAGYTSYDKNLMLEFSSDTTGVYFKIKDITAGTYWSYGGSDIKVYVSGTGTNTDGDGDLQDNTNAPIDLTDSDWGASADGSDASIDWLAIDIDESSNWEAGDKVYFKTYANTVILKFQVVNGPTITSVAVPPYVTLGKTVNLNVYGDEGSSSSATVTVVEKTSSGGTLTAGTDSDGDSVSQEVWTYTAPTTMPSSATATFIVSITDGTYTNTREVSVELNQEPTITGITGSDTVDVTNGNWILSGTSPVTLVSSVSDSDSGDTFKYFWTIGGNGKYGTLTYDNTSAVDWSPYNGATALGDVDGPYTNGHFNINLLVMDKDSEGVLKGGTDSSAIDVGVNEAPTIASVMGGARGTDYWSGAIVEKTSSETYDFGANDEYKNVTLSFYPDSTLTDAADDKNSLNFDWYITLDSSDGPIVANPGKIETESKTINSIPAQMLKWTPDISLRGVTRTYYLHSRVTDDKSGVAKGISDKSFAFTVTADDDAPGLVDNEMYVQALVDKAPTGTFSLGDKIRLIIPIGASVTAVSGGTTLTAATASRDLMTATVNIGGLIDGTAGGPTAQNVEFSYNNNGTASDYSDDYLYYDLEIKAASAPSTNYTDGAIDTGGADDVNPPLVSAQDWNGNETAAGVGNDDLIKNGSYLDSTGTTVAASPAIDSQPVIGDVSSAEIDNTDIAVTLNEANNGTFYGYTKDNDMITLNDELTFIADIDEVHDNDKTSDVGSIYAPQLGIAGSGYIPGFRRTDTGGTANSNIVWSFSFTSGNVNAGKQDSSAAAAYTGILADQVVTTSQGYTGDTGTYNLDFWFEDNAGNRTHVEKDALAGGTIDGIDLRRPKVANAQLYSYSSTATTGQAGWAPVLDMDTTNVGDTDGDHKIDRTGTDRMDGNDDDLYLFGWLEVSSSNLDDNSTSTAEILKLTFDEPLLVGNGSSTTTFNFAAPVDGGVGVETDGNLVSSVNDTSIKVYNVSGSTRTEVSNHGVSNLAATTAGDTVELDKIKNYAVRYLDTNGDQTWTTADAVKTEVYIVLLSTTATGDSIDSTSADIGHFAKGKHFEVEFNAIDRANHSSIATQQVMDRNTNFINASGENMTGDDGITWE
ncbi:beta strand repeat-containing protein [Haliovirga abyssi]|uniref:Dystroglycan-type cadherin-like domain-containing protein n=1 Tax=Haliovirga abyssi TaxID=2996794 RepID=A0AAU9DCB7_9FUSO|nr:hypothetical protein [Haliovirga abyssi]BDU51126.1 hypothetical protein HLVA_16950 [Haliovirga abyssi]